MTLSYLATICLVLSRSCFGDKPAEANYSSAVPGRVSRQAGSTGTSPNSAFWGTQNSNDTMRRQDQQGTSATENDAARGEPSLTYHQVLAAHRKAHRRGRHDEFVYLPEGIVFWRSLAQGGPHTYGCSLPVRDRTMPEDGWSHEQPCSCMFCAHRGALTS